LLARFGSDRIKGNGIDIERLREVGKVPRYFNERRGDDDDTV